MAPEGYKAFHDRQNEVTKGVLKPGWTAPQPPLPA